MKKKLFLINSDFGVSNTIGARVLPIVKEMKKKEVKVFCRDYPKHYGSLYDLETVIFQGKFLMQLLTAIPIYLYKKFPANHFRNYLFDFFLLQKLKKEDLENVDIVHSWDFLPLCFEYIKNKNSNIIIIQDVAIGLTPILKEIPNAKKYFGLSNFDLYNYIKKSFEYIDEFTVPSNFVKDSIMKTKEYNNQKINIIPFGVNSKKFKPKKRNDNSFNVAFSGNINYRKGIPTIIKVWKELNLKNANLNFYGRLYPEVKSYFKDSKKYSIFIHGFVDIKKELPKNHVFLFPSLMEGSAKAVYEAMACSMPVITTYNAGSIIKNNNTGFIVDNENIDQIKEKLLFFYNNRKNIYLFGKRARKQVEKYSWEKYAKEVLKTYKQK